MLDYLQWTLFTKVTVAFSPSSSEAFSSEERAGDRVPTGSNQVANV